MSIKTTNIDTVSKPIRCNSGANPYPSRDRLLEAWAHTYGHPPPKGMSTRLLHLSCEYHRQVRQHGGLKKARLRELLRYAKPLNETQRLSSKSPKSPKPSVGTRLVREWQGKTHVVDVLEGSVLYRDKTYRSLSQVARTITGARWSGPRFFGI